MLKQKIPWKKAVADWGFVAILLLFFLKLSTEVTQRISFEEEIKKKMKDQSYWFYCF